MTHATNAMIREVIKKRLPENQEIDSMEFGEIKE
jgi:hypothetical protein